MIDRIVFDDVNHSFGDNMLFKGLSCELIAGRIITIIGANGSGKSTFLKLAGQFIKPDSGRIGARIKGQGSSSLVDSGQRLAVSDIAFNSTLSNNSGDAAEMKAVSSNSAFRIRDRVAVVAPSINLYSELTAAENLTFFIGLRDRRISEEELERLFNRVNLNIEDKLKVVGNFSTGMKQRLKFAIMLAADADVWLLDEPSSNLDEAGREIILTEARCAAAAGKLILLATNDREEAEAGDETISLPIR